MKTKICNIFSVASLCLEKAMATHSSTLAWSIPWTEEPGGLQSMGSQRVGHDWATSLSLFTFMHWRRKWQPTPVFLPGESQGRRNLWAAVYGVAQSQTRLTRLNSSSSSLCLALLLVEYLPLILEIGNMLVALSSTFSLPDFSLEIFSIPWFPKHLVLSLCI